MLYALDPDVFEHLVSLKKASNLSEIPDAFLQRVTGRARRGEHMMIAGDTAAIPIIGVLEKQPSWYSFFFGGGTIYGDVVQAINDANANDQVKNIILELDTPGGAVEGIKSVIDAIRGSPKPVIAHVTDKALSAGYWIASQASGGIYANNDAAIVGSVGVVTQRRVDDTVVTLTSTKAPDKAPDAGTEEGRNKIKADLDRWHARFAGDVANGRNISIEKVDTDFGKGGVVLAEAALAAGMIDGISVQDVGPSASDKAERKESKMDLNTLKAEHPSVYAAAVAEGRTEGIESERKRTSALLIYGKGSGDMDHAMKAIKDGTDASDPELTAHFNMAAINKRDREDRANDNLDDVQTGAQDVGASGEKQGFNEHLDVDALIAAEDGKNG